MIQTRFDIDDSCQKSSIYSSIVFNVSISDLRSLPPVFTQQSLEPDPEAFERIDFFRILFAQLSFQGDGSSASLVGRRCG
jgi:hypothetical protein